MPDIKTKETIKDIKVLDKSANLAARMREAWIESEVRRKRTDPSRLWMGQLYPVWMKKL